MQGIDSGRKGIREHVVEPHLSYRTVSAVNGPLVILEGIKNPTFAEIVSLTLGDGSTRRGQVCDFSVVFVCLFFLTTEGNGRKKKKKEERKKERKKERKRKRKRKTGCGCSMILSFISF